MVASVVVRSVATPGADTRATRQFARSRHRTEPEPARRTRPDVACSPDNLTTRRTHHEARTGATCLAAGTIRGDPGGKRRPCPVGGHHELADRLEVGPQPPLVNEQLVTATPRPNGLPRMPSWSTASSQQTSRNRTSSQLPRQLIRGTRTTGKCQSSQATPLEYPVGGQGQTSAARLRPPSPSHCRSLSTLSTRPAARETRHQPNLCGGLKRRHEDPLHRHQHIRREATDRYTDAGGNSKTVEQPVFLAVRWHHDCNAGTRRCAKKDAGTAVVSTNPAGQTIPALESCVVSCRLATTSKTSRSMCTQRLCRFRR